MKKPSIAIFGYSGFIGAKCYEALRNDKVEVWGISRRGKGLVADVRDINSLEALSIKPDVVINCTSKLPVKTPSTLDVKEFFETNVIGTNNLLNWSIKSGVKRFIHCSTLSLVSDRAGVDKSINEQSKVFESGNHFYYKTSKLASEIIVRSFCEQHDIDYLILRLSSVYGPGMEKLNVIFSFLEALKKNSPLVVNHKNMNTDFIYVSDVVEALCKSIDSEVTNETIHIANGASITMYELAVLVKEIVGKNDHPIEILNDAPWVRKQFSNYKMKTKLKMDGLIDMKSGLTKLIDSLV